MGLTGGGDGMSFLDFLKSRRKKAVLFFLAGFFFGGILYYLCQEPAAEALKSMEENILMWATIQQDFWPAFLFVLWERGKVFSVLWLASYTKIYKIYICAFLVYAGMQSGFLLTFFVMFKGIKGILYWLSAGCPQMIVLIPLYIYSFYRIFERRREKAVSAVLLIVFCFVASCVLEAELNLPFVQWVLTY